MIVICPSCKSRFRIKNKQYGTKGLVLRCSRCRTLFRIKETAHRYAEGDPSGKIEILIATDSPAIRDTVISHLDNKNFNIYTAEDGHEALEKIINIKPKVALLDVGIPKLMGFEVCERVRRNNEVKDTIIILIASVYRKMRYKRKPESLYGADDYIEKHHIPDELLTKIYGLISGQRMEQAAAMKEEIRPQEVIQVQEIGVEKLAEERSLLIRDEEIPPVEDEEYLYERAKRLARTIISDIALYNERKVYDGIKNGNFFEILKEEIEEGFEFFSRNVPELILRKYNILKEEIDEFILRKKKELGLI